MIESEPPLKLWSLPFVQPCNLYLHAKIYNPIENSFLKVGRQAKKTSSVFVSQALKTTRQLGMFCNRFADVCVCTYSLQLACYRDICWKRIFRRGIYANYRTARMVTKYTHTAQIPLMVFPCYQKQMLTWLKVIWMCPYITMQTRHLRTDAF